MPPGWLRALRQLRPQEVRTASSSTGLVDVVAAALHRCTSLGPWTQRHVAGGPVHPTAGRGPRASGRGSCTRAVAAGDPATRARPVRSDAPSAITRRTAIASCVAGSSALYPDARAGGSLVRRGPWPPGLGLRLGRGAPPSPGAPPDRPVRSGDPPYWRATASGDHGHRPALSPSAAALVQLALDHGAPAAVVSADAALARRARDDRGQLAAGGSSTVTDVPRSQRADAMLSFLDPLSESPGESRLRVMLASHGFAVASQVVIRDGVAVVARADLAIEGTRVLIEFDGFVKYRRRWRGGRRPREAAGGPAPGDSGTSSCASRGTTSSLRARVLATVRAAVARDLADRPIAR